MTTLAGRPAGGVSAQATGTSTPDADVPVLVSGTDLLGVQPGSGYVEPPQLVRRVDGQVLQLTPLLYAVLDAVDGRRDFAEIAAVATRTAGRELHADDVKLLVEDKLRPLALVQGVDGSHPPLTRSNPLLALRARFVVSKPEVTRRITAPFAVLFNPLLVVVTTLAFAAIAFWVLFQKGLGHAAYQAFHQPGLLLAVFAITVVSAGFHEFGHAAALRRGGGTPGAMGAGLYLIYPAFYTDVTDSYRLGRGARIRTDLGGLYFNALVAIAMFGVWAVARWDGLLLVIAAQILQMIRQLPPLVRFDGYHLLADITGVPDLFHRIGPTLRSFLPRRWRGQQSRELKLWARLVVTLWTVTVVPLLLVTALLSIVALPRIIGTTVSGVRTQAHLLDLHAGRGDYAGAGVKALAIAALVIPVGGILYMLVRMTRRYAVTAWRRTRGKPAKRALAGAVAVAVLGGLAFAWWPREGLYRPIQPYERGTIQNAVVSMPLRSVAPSLQSSVATAGLREGERRTTTTIWPNDHPLPTADHPVPAIVLSPKDSTAGLPTWVFPFDRPDAPGIGDNQAMAVVTQDGGTVYDATFALVWADGDTVVNKNEAYAFASCTKCTAVAVSFQVVVVVGDAHVVAPENVAAAISYDCLDCVTAALAVQLVVQEPDGLSPDAVDALNTLWSQIAAWGEHLDGLTFAQIQEQLTEYQKEILAIVKPELTEPSGSASPSPSVSGSAGTAGATTSTASPSESGSASPSSSSTTGSATPAATSTSAQSTEPSPAPSETAGTAPAG